MASNRIVKKIGLATIQKFSQEVVLEAAIETQTFNRTEELVNTAKARLVDIVQNSDTVLPPNTANAVVREFEHGADNHIDVVCLDQYGKYITTAHVVPKK
ncbi:MAG: hypothetical protein L6R35_003821 [Caloplaca aegaea]|nr:MAG: hypothetical protein L6R35_003821 [Caloplaca aegaea]